MKRTAIFLLALLLLCGCQKNTRQLDEEKYNAYMVYYQSILDEDDKLTSSQSYDIELVVNKLSENSYRYDVIIDNPRVAMHKIKALAVIDDLSATVSLENMMPSIGMLDDSEYNMIPGTVDKSRNYVEGVILSLTSDKPELKIGVMVEYTNSSKIKNVREYLSLYARYSPEAADEQQN